MMFFGIAFLIVVCSLSLLLINPPHNYIPQRAVPAGGAASPKGIVSQQEKSASAIMKTGAFWKLWFIYFIGAGAGLMVIGSVAGMAKKSMGEAAFAVVAIMAVGNAGGRVIAGILSDKIGRSATLMIMLLFQALLMFACIPVMGSASASAFALVMLATLIGFNYGTNLSLFPSLTKDFWGLKNFGMNYGIVFTAWGVGGFVMSRISQMLKASSGSFTSSFIFAGVLLAIGGVLTLTLRTSEKSNMEVVENGLREAA
jgi:nitrate/nitrite transporter NarK